MDRVAFDLGFIQIYWYSIFIFLAIITALIIIKKESQKQKLKTDTLVDLAFYAIIFGILGARLYYVIFNLGYYVNNPLEIIQIWNGGLAIHGGLLAALVYILIFCKKNKLNTLKLLDIIVVGLIIGQAIGRWGNFFNHEAYGAITTLEKLQSQGIPNFIINEMYILGEYRQPTFLYESIWCLIGFIIMIIIRKFYKKLKNGQILSFYLIWYGIDRLIIETLRADSLMVGPIKIAQVISFIFIISGIVILCKIQKKYKKEANNLYKDDNIKIETKVSKK